MIRRTYVLYIFIYTYIHTYIHQTAQCVWQFAVCIFAESKADILSDRIAIIAEGRLTAIASSMALKFLGAAVAYLNMSEECEL